jgi:hypothetical protein
VGLNSLKSLNLTNVYPYNKKKKNKVKSKPLELYELAGKNWVDQSDAAFYASVWLFLLKPPIGSWPS